MHDDELAVNGALALVLGGSFWRPYLFTLVPGIVLCAVLLLAVRVDVARRAQYLVAFAAVVSIGATAAWTVVDLSGHAPSPTTRTGVALRAAAEPGDTMVVYGGRAEIVLASGMHSPYQHLWSLPMRTLDPRLTELGRLLVGSRAPTWVVMWVSPGAWDGTGAVLEPLLEERVRPRGAEGSARRLQGLGSTRSFPSRTSHNGYAQSVRGRSFDTAEAA